MILLDITEKGIMKGKMILGPKTKVNTFNFPSQHVKRVYFVNISDIFNRTSVLATVDC